MRMRASACEQVHMQCITLSMNPYSSFPPVWFGERLGPLNSFVLNWEQDRCEGPGKCPGSGWKHLLPAQTKHSSRSQEPSIAPATVWLPLLRTWEDCRRGLLAGMKGSDPRKKKLKPINKLKSLMEGVWSFSFSFFFINEIWALPLRTPQVGDKATLRVMTKGLGARMCLFRAFRARTSSDWVFQGGGSRNSKVSA